MDDFNTWLDKGNKYFSVVQGKNGNPCKLSPTIQYNLVCLAFESYVMAILDFHSKLPENHSITDLLNALETVMPVNIDLRNRIIKHEIIQLICPLIEYNRRDPSIEEVDEFKLSIQEISALANKTIGKNQVKSISKEIL
jgi:hypothetical protein